jgi:hypothetical protein
VKTARFQEINALPLFIGVEYCQSNHMPNMDDAFRLMANLGKAV